MLVKNSSLTKDVSEYCLPHPFLETGSYYVAFAGLELILKSSQALTLHSQGRKDGSHVKALAASAEDPGPDPSTHTVVHSCLDLPFQGISWLPQD